MEDLFCGQCGWSHSGVTLLPPLETTTGVSVLEVGAEAPRDPAPALASEVLASVPLRMPSILSPPSPPSSPLPVSSDPLEVLPVGWYVSFPDLPAEADIALTRRVVVLGRRPTAPTRFPTAQLVQIDDGKGMTSKSHIRLEFHDEVWEATDMGSLNGVIIIRTAINGDGMMITMGELTAHLIKGELPQ